MTAPDQLEITIEEYLGARAALRPLFELAEDSEAEVDSYVHTGRVLVARIGQDIVGHLQLVDTGVPGEVELKNMAVRSEQQGRDVGARLIQAACGLLAREDARILRVATAAASTGNLRFYQRQGFRMRSVERDAFTAATGYPPGIEVEGIPLRDRVSLDTAITPRPSGLRELGCAVGGQGA
jgi:GNAT superfamily N-acetyltransferase